MTKKIKPFSKQVPPCPGDPEKYTLVRGKYGYRWRRKRGTVTPAKLNTVLALSASLTKPTNEAAARVMDKLAFFTQRMELQRVSVKIAGAFKKSCLKTGKMDYSLLEDMDFQEEHPFSNLIKGQISKTIVNDSIYLRIHVGKACFKKLTNMVSGYELHAIMLFGDPAKENSLRIESERSRHYSIKEEAQVDCDFSFVLPPKNRPWMVLVHVACTISVPVKPGPRYYGMKVVKAGEG